MKLFHGVIFLSLGASPHIHADSLEGRLGFSGMVTETTCVVGIGEGGRVPSSPTERLAGSVSVSLKQCPEKILKGTSMSLRDVAIGVPSPDFSHQSGEKIVKGDILEHSRFLRKNLLEAHLPLILKHPVSGASTEYTAVFHLSYD